MKILHLSDLHLGRRLGDYSLLADQKNVLRQALDIVCKHACDAVIIAGDIYDKPSPSAEAMNLFNDFISELVSMRKKVFMISGNHDSTDRIAYYGDIISACGIYASKPFDGTFVGIDAGENVKIYLLPFIKPVNVRAYFSDMKITTYEEAVTAVINSANLDKSEINIIVAHQFITGAETCDSEEFAVGGLDNISADVFADFDYAALGHIHRAQRCSRDTVRYAGSPLKYSLSEEKHRKIFTILEISNKENIKISEIPIKLPHDVRTVKGTFEELTAADFTEDYVKIVLTDELVIPDARIALRSNFPNMLKFSVENSKTSFEADVASFESVEQRSPLELLSEFYAFQNNGAGIMDEQLKIAEKIFTELEGSSHEAS